MRMRHALLAVAAVVAVAPVASAQPAPDPKGSVPVTISGQGSDKGLMALTSPTEVILDNDGNFPMFLAMRGLQTTPAFDERAEIAVGIALGTRPTGGYSVTVTKAEWDGANCKVTYVVTSPAPGTTPPAGESYPWVVAQFQRPVSTHVDGRNFTFVDATPPAAGAFTSLAYRVSGSFPVKSTSLTLDWNGAASLAVQKPGAEVTRATGKATPSELDDLRAKFLAAQVCALDGKNLTARPVPDAPTFRVETVVDGKNIKFTGTAISLGANQAAVQPLLAALDALAARLDTSNVRKTVSIYGFVKVAADGSITISETGPVMKDHPQLTYKVEDGPLSAVLKTQDGKLVTAQASVLGTSAQVLGLQATNNTGNPLALQDADGKPGSNEIPAGGTVAVTGSSADGKSLAVSLSSGSGPIKIVYKGFVPNDSLTLGGTFAPHATPGVIKKLGE